MADAAPVVHIGENSPERVAYVLQRDVLNVEKYKPRTREYILDSYAECIHAVRGLRNVPKKN